MFIVTVADQDKEYTFDSSDKLWLFVQMQLELGYSVRITPTFGPYATAQEALDASTALTQRQMAAQGYDAVLIAQTILSVEEDADNLD